MTQHDFCMWLNGYVELDGKTPTDDQWEMIKEHLALLFNKTTRSLEEIRQDTIKESEERRNQNLEWVNRLLQKPESPDNEPTIVEKPEIPVVDGPKELEPKPVQQPWIIPDLQYPNFQRNKPWFEPPPFDLNNLKVTC